MRLTPSPTDWVADALAVEMYNIGLVVPYSITIQDADTLAMTFGTANGSTLANGSCTKINALR